MEKEKQTTMIKELQDIIASRKYSIEQKKTMVKLYIYSAWDRAYANGEHFGRSEMKRFYEG